jgi:hypothetical protein
MTTPNPADRSPGIATGNRRAETHYERDKDQMVRVAHLEKPQAPLPRHEGTVGAGLEPEKPGEPIEDVKVDVAESSVWDGRPSEEQITQDVPRQGGPHASPERTAHADDDPPKPPFPPSELVSKRAGG